MALSICLTISDDNEEMVKHLFCFPLTFQITDYHVTVTK